MLRITFVALFPEAALAPLRQSITGRAESAGLVAYDAVNPRDFATDRHRSVDDEPYGGGPGMVMKPDVLGAALESVLTPDSYVVLTDPGGLLFRQAHAAELSKQSHLVFVCGHYEGVDERFAERYVHRRHSIGDYVLTGGELAAAVMADAIVRLVPGVLGSPASLAEDAFGDGLLTYPQYTRPETWQGLSVPSVLLSGDHEAIARWRRRQRLLATRRRRPDLFAMAPLSKSDLELLK